MKQIIAALAVSAALIQPAAADDRQVFGAIVGAVIGYHLMKEANTVEVQPQVVISAPAPRRHYHPQTVVVVQQPQRHRHYNIHPQTVRRAMDTCTVYGRGHHGSVVCN
jgi:hypothetical protein